VTTTMALMTMTATMMATTVMPTTMATMLARRPSAARTRTANATTYTTTIFPSGCGRLPHAAAAAAHPHGGHSRTSFISPI